MIKLAKKECSFSVVLASRASLIGLVLNGERGKGVTLNGSLGEITSIEFLDASVMVITGKNGVIRLDLTQSTLQNMLKEKH